MEAAACLTWYTGIPLGEVELKYVARLCAVYNTGVRLGSSKETD